MQKFLSGGKGRGGEEGVGIISVFITHNTLSSVQRAQVPLIFHESQPHPTYTTEVTKIPWIFFSTWKEGKGTVKESESVTDTPPYFEKNTKTNPMSVRGETAATRFIVCNFTLLSP